NAQPNAYAGQTSTLRQPTTQQFARVAVLMSAPAFRRRLAQRQAPASRIGLAENRAARRVLGKESSDPGRPDARPLVHRGNIAPAQYANGAAACAGAPCSPRRCKSTTGLPINDYRR